jgi:photosystem II biogenesis protein Psp29
VSISQTVADSKRRFYNAYPRVIPGLYRRVVDELLVELHLLSCQQGFQADALFALGLTQVFDNFSVGFEPVDRREQLFSALCEAADLSAPDLRQQAQRTSLPTVMCFYLSVFFCLACKPFLLRPRRLSLFPA